ncbi:MAG: hypothetical protein Q8Q82_17165, partial [Hydrogenophaga sp.]|nr:hypothetical protein [Hydrogenophaga sp.]
MSEETYNYESFQLDWWDMAGAEAEAVGSAIDELIAETFGPGGLSAAKSNALSAAARAQFTGQQALKLAGVAAQEAYSYADLPDSPQFRNALANRIAYENIARSAFEDAQQIVRNSGVDLDLATKLKNVASVLGPTVNVMQMGSAVATGDAYIVAQKAAGVLAGMAFGALAVGTISLLFKGAGLALGMSAGALTAPFWLLGGAAIVAGLVAGKVGEWAWQNGAADFYGISEGDEFSSSRLFGGIVFAMNQLFASATSTRPAPVYTDPLAIDLDGDGIETVGIGSDGQPVSFDHNADGVRTGTGWVTGDDAWLVLDRNGNGSIDSGRELFGVDALKSNGQLATSGLDALRDLDGNADSVFNASDAAFTQVRLWQDLNQDGISQSDELFRLSDKGIVSIGLTGSTGTTNLGNGNTVVSTAIVTRADGSTTTASDLNVAHNPFYRDFVTEVPLSETALALPEMGGAGWVRDLREAMSLGTAQADVLAAQVQAFAAGSTKVEQMASLDDLIRAWAATNEYVPLKPLDDPLRRFVVTNNPAMSAQMQAVIPVLEIFNGLGVAQAGMQNPVLSTITAPDGTSQQVQTYTLFAEQVQPMLNAYEQLRQSVYGALVMQTRLKPYLDAVELTIGEEGIEFSTVGITSLLQSQAGTDALNAITDLLDLRRYGSDSLNGIGWKFENTFAATMEGVTVTPEITALLNSEKVAWIGATTTSFTVSAAQAGFVVIGNALNNTITGSAAAADALYGGEGSDTLIAGGNYATLAGGAGDDVLRTSSPGNIKYTSFNGGAGNDT